MKNLFREDNVFKSLSKIFLWFCLFFIFCFFSALCYAEGISLEEFMRGVTTEILNTKQTKEILRDRTKFFKDLKIVGKNAGLIMAGFDCDEKGKSNVNIYAYLYYDPHKPAYYCLVIDNFGKSVIQMNSQFDEYLFKYKNNKYFTPYVMKKYYRNGALAPGAIAYVDLGVKNVRSENIEALFVRINFKKTLLYLTGIPQK